MNALWGITRDLLTLAVLHGQLRLLRLLRILLRAAIPMTWVSQHLIGFVTCSALEILAFLLWCASGSLKLLAKLWDVMQRLKKDL